MSERKAKLSVLISASGAMSLEEQKTDIFVDSMVCKQEGIHILARQTIRTLQSYARVYSLLTMPLGRVFSVKT